MKYSEWRTKLAELYDKAGTAELAYRAATDELTSFYKTTLGVAPGVEANVLSTAEMICQVIKMKGEESGDK